MAKRKPPKPHIPPPEAELAPAVPAEEVGYARVSTSDQSVDMQVALLKKRGIPDDNIFTDTVSGGRMSRKGLDLALKLMSGRKGWTLVVWKLDRLGRDALGMMKLAARFEECGWNLVSLTEQIDTRTPFGRFYFHMLAILAQLERDMTIERTRAGLARRKERGYILGRPTRLKPKALKEIKRLLEVTKAPIPRIAKRYKVTASTINHHFPAWRSKTEKERKAYRRAHPFVPQPEDQPGR
jgi:DNA invertase Pin-like site-specific DNA recombinase